MPFAKGAEVRLINESGEAVQLGVAVESEQGLTNESAYGRFHARWHFGDSLDDPDRDLDTVFLNATGPGRFCGLLVHVWNPVPAWWGEGDEKFYVDGEVFPSTFGTGAEDYFGYAWCQPGTFSKPYHAMPFNFRNKQATVLRWQIAENVPFQKSFLATLEGPHY